MPPPCANGHEMVSSCPTLLRDLYASQVQAEGHRRLDQFGPKLGLLTRFDGGEWFALDLVHHTVLRLFESANNSQQ
jgi:hypothetical protein